MNNEEIQQTDQQFQPSRSVQFRFLYVQTSHEQGIQSLQQRKTQAEHSDGNPVGQFLRRTLENGYGSGQEFF